jgi:hypothetical protein
MNSSDFTFENLKFHYMALISITALIVVDTMFVLKIDAVLGQT